MNLQDQVLYRCIHAACARPLPHKVNFCPYCGTPQREGGARPVAAAPVSVAKEPEVIYRAPAPASSVPQPAPVAFAEPAPAVPPPPSAKPQPRIAAAAVPPQPQPIRLRYWLMALAILAMIWFYAKPSSKRIEARIDQAITLANECKSSEAQEELIALREDKATSEQLRRLQSAMNGAAAVCDKKRARAKSWNDTVTAVNSALDDGDAARAQVRLSQFTKRFGEDAETRALKAKIAAQRDAEAPAPRATPVPSAAQRSQSARNLIGEAERQIALGNYKAASDKLETCITMIEGSRECVAYKAHADRLLREMQLCLAAGRDWSRGRCS